jgi:tetratricopeptide (TPR) repeat protein
MNPAHATNWIPGLIVLAVAIVGAIAFLFGSKRLKTDAPAPQTLDDFEARYQTLLGTLREHIANQHLLPPEEFARERARLESAAADVLRAKEGKKHDAVKQQARAEKLAAATPQGFFGKNPMLGGMVLGGVVVGFFALLGWQLQDKSTERTEGMQATGMTPPGGAPMQQAQRADSKLEGLSARVQSNPEDVDALADLSIYLIRRQAFQEAKPLVDRAMLIDPFHPKARVGHAVMRALEGDLRGSLDELERLAQRYPESYDARMFAGMLALEDNDERRALANLEVYVSLAPMNEQPPMMRMAVVQLKQQLAAQQEAQPPGP